MKTYLQTLLLCLLLSSFAQGMAQSYELDAKDPESVLGVLFYAAKTEDFNLLPYLCDPLHENDGDTRNVCSLSEVNEKAKAGDPKSIAQLQEFILYFKDAQINGEIAYLEKEGEKGAAIPFIFGPSGKQRQETMYMVERYGNWYLASF